MESLKLSRHFVAAIKLAEEPAYKIAVKAKIHPSMLSKLLHGAERIRPEDRRVLAVARVLGLSPDDCFEVAPSSSPQRAARRRGSLPGSASLPSGTVRTTAVTPER